jgi:hypothetical protein
MMLIDKCDEPLLGECKWRVDSQGYASGRYHGKQVRLHRVITGAAKHQIVDHVNGDRLDNRRGNLRLTDRCGNARNSKFRSHNTSGYRGVYKCSYTGRWRAEIRVRGKGIKLGRFDDVRVAAAAYDEAARRLHGDFAVLNGV